MGEEGTELLPDLSIMRVLIMSSFAKEKKKVIEMERNGVEINHWRLSVQKLEQYCDDVSYFFFFKHTYLT